MYRKNTAGQFITFTLTLIANGAPATGLTPTCRRCIDGTFAAATGTITEDTGLGFYKMALSQADTNGNDIGFRFLGTGATDVVINIVTTAGDPTDGVRFGLTALPNAAANAAGGLPISAAGGLALDTKIGGLTFTSAGKVDANTLFIEGVDATDQIRDSILSDATRFAGADIAAIKGFIDTEISTLITNVGTVITNVAAVKTVVDTINTNTDTEIASIISTLATVLGLIDTEVASILTAANAIKVTTDKFVFTTANQVDAGVIDKTGFSLTADFRLKKNTALASFTFGMVDASGNPATGLTVSGQRTKDGGAAANLDNAITEISIGLYKVSITANDINCDTFAWVFTAVGAKTLTMFGATQTE